MEPSKNNDKTVGTEYLDTLRAGDRILFSKRFRPDGFEAIQKDNKEVSKIILGLFELLQKNGGNPIDMRKRRFLIF